MCFLVPGAGIEPAHGQAIRDFKSLASTYSATQARERLLFGLLPWTSRGPAPAGAWFPPLAPPAQGGESMDRGYTLFSVVPEPLSRGYSRGVFGSPPLKSEVRGNLPQHKKGQGENKFTVGLFQRGERLQ